VFTTDFRRVYATAIKSWMGYYRQRNRIERSEIPAVLSARQCRPRGFAGAQFGLYYFFRQASLATEQNMLASPGRHCPMKESSVVRSDPDILGGTPVFLGTRVPVQALIDYIEGGHSLKEFLDDFPTVSREIVVAALEQAKAHLIADARAA
jgi:uncharacterized protein (DUF433 family)